MEYDLLIVGAGITGATIAERASSELGWRVLVIDRRDHIGGNVYDYTDPATGIRVNKYGAHIFHTNDEDVWEYVQRFAHWSRWDHKVLALVDGKYVPVPANMDTVNALFNLSLRTEEDMASWLKEQQIPCAEPRTGEEIALSRVGPVLYEKLFKHYTKKQWNKFPEELDASVLARIPVRTNNDCRYFTDKYQALPTEGYTAFVDKMLASPFIEVRLGTEFADLENSGVRYRRLVYTGPIDAYFKDAGLPTLEYRSVEFHTERLPVPGPAGFYQPVSQVNYPSADIPYTRTVEYKHFLNQASPTGNTIIVHETTTDDGDPYYPVPNAKNQELYEKYRQLAEAEESAKNVGFVGRLASYKYFNMDQAIRAALDFYYAKLRQLAPLDFNLRT
jgi:UDP-galactopyranose mutase